MMLMLKLESHNPFMQEHSTLACGVSVCSSQLRRRWQKLMRCRCVILVLEGADSCERCYVAKPGRTRRSLSLIKLAQTFKAKVGIRGKLGRTLLVSAKVRRLTLQRSSVVLLIQMRLLSTSCNSHFTNVTSPMDKTAGYLVTTGPLARVHLATWAGRAASNLGSRLLHRTKHGCNQR